MDKWLDDKLFPTHYPAEFESFWAIYPCKQAKGTALSSFKKARLKASFTELLAAVGRYKAFLAANPKRNPALASTWLNQERWLDEYDQPRDDTSWKVDRAIAETMRRRMQ